MILWKTNQKDKTIANLIKKHTNIQNKKELLKQKNFKSQNRLLGKMEQQGLDWPRLKKRTKKYEAMALRTRAYQATAGSDLWEAGNKGGEPCSCPCDIWGEAAAKDQKASGAPMPSWAEETELGVWGDPAAGVPRKESCTGGQFRRPAEAAPASWPSADQHVVWIN